VSNGNCIDPPENRPQPRSAYKIMIRKHVAHVADDRDVSARSTGISCPI
jgi:hypothetical protein